MLPEKWKNLIDDIDYKFKIEKQGKEHIDDQGGVDIEFVIFEGPMGKVKLEFVTKPVILDKKTNYSQRIGSQSNVEYVYSEDEKTHRLVAYKWSDTRNDWKEVNADNFN